MSDVKSPTTLPTYRVLFTNNDAADAQQAIVRVIASVCSDGNSDVSRVARDVVTSLAAAGFSIVRINLDA